MLALYNALLILVLALASPGIVLLLLMSPRLRQGMLERLRPLAASQHDQVWVHAASVGEAEAAVSFVRLLRQRGVTVVATTLTVTGRDRLRTHFPEMPVRLAPLDLPWLSRISVRRAAVRVLVLVETEIWPNAIATVSAEGGAVLVVGGRISDSSLRRYRRLSGLFAPLLGRIHGVLARSAEDAERFIELGVVAQRVTASGDLKLDRAPPSPPSPELREAIGPGRLLVAGSTHAGEEDALLTAWCEMAETTPGLRLVLVPRHLERVADVCAMVRKRGAHPRLRSDGRSGNRCDAAGRAEVVVVDTMGELSALYVLADFVFVGGSLVPVGGHNLLEPVQAGRVVVHGPHVEDQRTQVRLLEPLGVLHRVHDAADLTRVLTRLASAADPNAPARAAQAVLESSRGAALRAADAIVEAMRA